MDNLKKVRLSKLTSYFWRALSVQLRNYRLTFDARRPLSLGLRTYMFIQPPLEWDTQTLTLCDLSMDLSEHTFPPPWRLTTTESCVLNHKRSTARRLRRVSPTSPTQGRPNNTDCSSCHCCARVVTDEKTRVERAGGRGSQTLRVSWDYCDCIP